MVATVAKSRHALRTGYAVVITESGSDWDPGEDEMPLKGIELLETLVQDANIDDAENIAFAANYFARRAGTKRRWAIVLMPGINLALPSPSPLFQGRLQRRSQ